MYTKTQLLEHNRNSVNKPTPHTLPLTVYPASSRLAIIAAVVLIVILIVSMTGCCLLPSVSLRGQLPKIFPHSMQKVTYGMYVPPC